MLYTVNEMIFASLFILIRMFLTPVVSIILFEAENTPNLHKIGTPIILFIQLFWCYRILFNIGEKLMEFYGALESKDKKVPTWVIVFHKVVIAINFDKRVKTTLSVVNLLAFVVAPVYYYGFVRRTLF